MEKFLGSRLLRAGFFIAVCPAKEKPMGGSTMKKFFASFCIAAVILLLAGHAFALNLGDNITISDKNYNSSGNNWYTNHEDGEVEPGMARHQGWDLEGFFLKDTMLSMVGGYDFVNGKSNLFSGDIFLDVDGDAEYGDIHNGGTAGNQSVNDTFGYDYVLDLNFDDCSDDGDGCSYKVYQLTDDSFTRTSYYKQNQGSNPWRYESGGIDLGIGGSFGYDTGLSDAAVGFEGGFHNVVSGLDLSFLGSEANFTAHFTMECGNDNLMGEGVTPPVATPEPGTLALLGIGVLGFVGLRRRKRA
jgi:hypothetical protein